MLVVPFFASGLRLAVKARFFWLAVLCFFSVGFAAFLVFQFGGREPAIVALDVGLSVVRLLVPLVGILLVQELISREFDRRYYLVSLSYPVSRGWLVFGRFLAVAFLVLMLLLILCVALVLLVRFLQADFIVDFDWFFKYSKFFLFCALDVLVVVAFSVFLSVCSSTSAFVLIGSLGFMLVARSYSGVMALLAGDSHLVNGEVFYERGLGGLGFIFPDLGRLDVRELVLYRVGVLPDDWHILVLSVLAYFFFLMLASFIVFQRKKI